MLSTPMKLLFCLLVLTARTLPQQNSYSFVLDSIDAHILLTMKTLDPVPCLGSTIRNQVECDGDTIVVITGGFIRPTPCIDGMDPASTRISLGRQAKATFYLRFREETFDDLWKVSRTEGGFEALPAHRSFTSYVKQVAGKK